ncbi:MAG: mucoidy inhibitor MuiA family protein [Flavobacteriaceae bacterium]
MKTISILLLFLIPIFNSVTTEDIVANHTIDEITVFLNSAEISRKSQVSISKGKSDVLFKGISSRILKEGLKVSLSNDVKVYAINIEENLDFLLNNSEWQQLVLKEEHFKSEESLLSVELNTLKKELMYLEANMNIGNNVSFTQIDEGATYFRNKMKALHIRIFEEENNIKKFQKSVAKFENEKRKLKEKLKKINSIIRITVISKTDTVSNVELRYLVSNAIWKPTYAIRTNGKGEDVTLNYQANIYNDTGNDWNHKPITLAIMDPLDDVTKPKMNSWVLDEESYNDEAEGRLSKAKGNYNQYDKNDTSYEVIPVDDLSTRFKIEDLHLIPSDATPHLIDVKTFVKKASYYTLSIPKVKDGAFVIASISNWENMGLLNGPISLYYKNTFQGVSQLNTQQVGKTLDISLGKDNSYTVTRRKLSSMRKEKFIGVTITDELTYELLVRNNRNEAMEIELRDQLPLSVDKSVVVEALNISNAQLDGRSGQLTWNLNLKPNETRRILLKFKVKYPKKKRGILEYDRKNLMSPRFF